MTIPLPAPRIGDIVHYVSSAGFTNEAAGPCFAALVTQVNSAENTRVGVRVFTPVEDFFQPLTSPTQSGCALDSGSVATARAPGTWHSADLAEHVS